MPEDEVDGGFDDAPGIPASGESPEIVMRHVSDLRPDPDNPRVKISGSRRAALGESLKRFGFVDPVIVDQGLVVVGGHQRLDVWSTDLGRKEVPTVMVTVTEAERSALAIVLNNPSAQSDWDYTKLAETLRKLRDSDRELLAATAFAEREAARIMGDLSKTRDLLEDFSMEPPPGKAWLVIQGTQADVARLRSAVEAAGLGDARVESVIDGGEG